MKIDKRNLIIALICAIALWVYVAGELNPTMTKTYRDIPIRYLNEQSLRDGGLAVVNYGEQTMDVTISGRRSDVAGVDRDELYATVDLSEAAAGNNRLAVSVTTPDGAAVSSQDVSSVNVRVERLLSAQKTIRVSYLGEFQAQYEPTTLSITPDVITVSGAQSLVNRVSYIRASVDGGSLGKRAVTNRVQLKAVDSKGRTVSHVRLSRKTVKVRSVLYETKAVPLKVNITGEDDGGLERSTTAPSQVTIKGPASVTDSISSIETKPVDLSGVTEDTSIALTPVLPSGVSLANESRSLVLKVTIDRQEDEDTKSFSFATSDVEVTGLSNSYTKEIQSREIVVTVKGTKAQLKKISAGDITLTMDLSSLEAGTHSVDVAASCSEDCSSVTVSPETLSVKLRKVL